MKNLKGFPLQVAVIITFAAGLALTPSCKNGGNTNSSTDTVAVDTMSTMSTMKTDTMKADTMKADTMKPANKTADNAVAPLPKKTTGVAMVVEPIPAPTEKIVEDKDHVYNHAEVPPVFPGGQSTMDAYVTDNIRYPQRALDEGVEGKVMVQFIVDEHGKVSHVTTLGKPIGYGLEEEAIRVISKSPIWIPGKVNGKNVKTYSLIPIVFTLK